MGRRYLPSRGTLFVVGVCLLGGVRVFVGSAAMPPFNEVDEMQHFDLVHKFARGYWPSWDTEFIDPDVAALRVQCGSTEFHRGPKETIPPPVWATPDGPERTAFVNVNVRELILSPNHEGHSPPAYYAVAGYWYEIGRLLGMKDAYAFYWMRFFNVPIFVSLIVVARQFAREYLPARQGPPLLILLALFPSTAFLSVTCDGFSALLFAMAFYLLLRWLDRPSAVSAFVAGLAVAATILNKLTNIVILIPCGIVLLLDLQRCRREARPAVAWLRSLILVLTVSVLVGGWVARNRSLFGDWTGDSFKLYVQHWKLKKAGIFEHPLVSLRGQSFFWTMLIPSFWFGDVSWRAQSIPPEWIRWLAIVLSPTLVLAAAAQLGANRDSLRSPLTIAVSLLVVGFAVLSLIVVSMIFDFTNAPFPSGDAPYLFCGRLLLGVLVPFLTLLITGIQYVSGGRARAGHVLFGVLCLMVIADQYAMLQVMLPSPFNWFHLPR
jgi:Predicted membrane protein (DUF2142)